MRGVRFHLIVGALAVVLLLDPVPAAAGGSTWDITPDPAAPGQPVHAEAVAAWAHNDGLGTPADGPWRAWIRPTAGPDDFRGGTSRITDDAVLVGDITIFDEGGFGTATVDFVVPEVAAGEYELIHCNDPCTSSLGDITWGAFTITGSERSDGVTPPAVNRQATVTSPPSEGADDGEGAPSVQEGELFAGLLAGAGGLVVLLRRHRAGTDAPRRSGFH